MPFLALVKGKGPSGFGYGSSAQQVTEGLDLSGKTYLLTGCNSGLGLETMRVLGMRGARLVAAARTEEKAQAALDQHKVDGIAVACELSEPASVRACVETIGEQGLTLDGMICNAGIMALPKPVVQHGLELQFLTNHIGHFILVTGLLECLAEDGRVVMLSSGAHTATYKEGIQFDNLDASNGYSPWGAYGQSKLANLLFAKHLATQFAGSKRTANSVHPGVIRTNLGRHMNPFLNFVFAVFGWPFLKSVGQGAATQCYVATHPSAATVSGEYFADCNVAKTSKHGRDDQMTARLWEVSEELVATL